MYLTNDVDGNELIPRKPRNLSDHNSGHWSLPGPVALSQRMLANSPHRLRARVFPPGRDLPDTN